jgi:hypothetical protein
MSKTVGPVVPFKKFRIEQNAQNVPVENDRLSFAVEPCGKQGNAPKI